MEAELTTKVRGGRDRTVAASAFDILIEDDLCKVVEALLVAKDKAYDLGLKLNLPPSEVRSICKAHSDPQEQLTAVIEYFLKQVEPRPTWTFIVNALKSPLVGLPRLAEEVAAATGTYVSISSSEAAAVVEGKTPGTDGENLPTKQEQKSPASPESSQMTPRYVKAKIKQFEKRFNTLKWATRDILKKSNVPVKHIVDAIADLPADEVPEHKQFLDSFLCVLYQAADQVELFGTLNTHLNYLSYDLLDHLVGEFKLEIKNDMETYKEDLRKFREKTPLKLFCETQKKRYIKLSSEFREVVGFFKWPDNVTLEVVEDFRQEYACHYKLRECAMMVAEIRPCSFIITWYVPESVVEKLKTRVPKEILQKYSASQLDIDGCCVYNKQELFNKSKFIFSRPVALASIEQGSIEHHAVSSPPPKRMKYDEDEPPADFICPVTYNILLQPHLTLCCGSHISPEAATAMQKDGMPCPLCKTASWSTVLNKHFQRQVKERFTCEYSAVSPKQLDSLEKTYPFLEQPQCEYFCPVDGSLLLQPCLTSCCGRHLSPEAANRIQGEGGSCPLCGEMCWNTVLNKHFQNEVKKLPVLCYNKDKGCGWQGQLCTLQRHDQSCPWREVERVTNQMDFLECLEKDDQKDKEPETAGELYYLSETLSVSGSQEELGNISQVDVTMAIQPLSLEETRDLFYQLGVPRKALDAVTAKYSGDSVKEQLVETWLSSDPDASWDKLFSGLQFVVADMPVLSTISPLGQFSATESSVDSLDDRVSVVQTTIEDLEDEFSDLMFHSRSLLCEKERENAKFFNEFQDFLMELGQTKLLYRNEDEALKARNMPEQFSILHCNCSYSNFGIIFNIIDKFCPALKNRMTTYRDSLLSFEKTTTVDVYLCAISAHGRIWAGFIRMAMRLNKSPAECTLYEIRVLKESLEKAAAATLQSCN